MTNTIYIKYNNKNYPVFISQCENKEDVEDGFINLKCEIANFDQDILKEDLEEYLEIMPSLIKQWKEAEEEIKREEKDAKKDRLILRISKKDKLKIEEVAKKK
ncbi:MAG: hypothetical protein LBQ24_03945 [Candidatus Peribacteria bacterium]|jgi:hypothetical protein|nr:hypothetical protein [Candidatus Peribacteria bacterium]